MAYGKTLQRSKTKRLTKTLSKNSGIATGKDFNTEKEFKDFLADWLEGRRLIRAGNQHDTTKIKKSDKKEKAKITRIEKEPQTDNGFGDIAIHHDFLDLSWNHALSRPFILELKNKSSFRDAVNQAVRYKSNSSKKYKQQGDRKYLDTGIATPVSLSNARITSKYTEQDGINEKNMHWINFEAKRIFWKLGIGVVQSANPDELIISFNEGDVVIVK